MIDPEEIDILNAVLLLLMVIYQTILFGFYLKLHYITITLKYSDTL